MTPKQQTDFNLAVLGVLVDVAGTLSAIQTRFWQEQYAGVLGSQGLLTISRVTDDELRERVNATLRGVQQAANALRLDG